MLDIVLIYMDGSVFICDFSDFKVWWAEQDFTENMNTL